MGMVLSDQRFKTAPQRVPTFYQFTSKNISKSARNKTIIIRQIILQKCIKLNKTLLLTECVFCEKVVVPPTVTWQRSTSPTKQKKTFMELLS